MAECSGNCEQGREAIAETASKLADKTRELASGRRLLDGRDEALERSEGLPEARRAQELAEVRKEAEKLRERSGSSDVTETLRKKLRVLLPVLSAKAVCMMAQVLRKIPPINKMMINWAEKQAPEDRHKLRTY